ncbi:hypothetical protein MKW94_018446 [Papaver nudicaule]|uniref:Uncharacterized protein n=1 Tax=Papaver nudicaule TaxID=74823 RepID=A0AA41S6A6_PAPNU|nr:hypothetical protein [Papaver nudicaule]
MMEQKVLHISVASLKRLSITNSKIYSCKPKIYSCKLKISAPNLQSLTYNGMPEDVHTDQTFSSIVDADIDITFQDVRYTEKGKERQCGLKNLLGGISDVKILHVSGSTLLTLYYEDIFTQMPTFHDLRRLVVSSELRLSMYVGLLRLLLILPNVESVVITQASPSSLSSP